MDLWNLIWLQEVSLTHFRVGGKSTVGLSQDRHNLKHDVEKNSAFGPLAFGEVILLIFGGVSFYAVMGMRSQLVTLSRANVITGVLLNTLPVLPCFILMTNLLCSFHRLGSRRDSQWHVQLHIPSQGQGQAWIPHQLTAVGLYVTGMPTTSPTL